MRLPFEIPQESITEAKQLLQAAQTVYEQSAKDPRHLPAVAQAQVRVGRALLRSGEALQAMPYLRDAVANHSIPDIRSMDANDILHLADARSVLGEGYRLRGDYLNAAREYGRALSELNVIPERVSTMSLRAVIKEKIGDAASEEGDADKAAAAYDAAYTILKTLTQQDEGQLSSRGLAIIRDKQGLLHQTRQNWTAAKNCFLEARHIRRGLAEQPNATDDAVCDLILSQQHLGDLYLAQEQDEQALFAYAAADLFRETHLKNPNSHAVQRLQATIAEHRSIALLRQKQVELASKTLADALETREKLYDETKSDRALANLAKTRGRIGDLQYQQSEWQEALKTYQLADDHLRSLAIRDWADPLRQANWAASVFRVGETARKCGQCGTALKAYRQASTIRERLIRRAPKLLDRYRDLAIVQERTASLLKGMHRHEAAVKMLRTGVENIETALKYHPKNVKLRRDLVILSHQLYELSSVAKDASSSVLWRIRTRNELESLLQEGIEFDSVLQIIQSKLAEPLTITP
ncbi:tetratricopeptide repeat protein [Thalassoroseus pseudoceratinae]|uniref:hypothetical protein n=1 Tax=Thalassoroseus pseudoceratinae TaxID=2713176 RepID=UPI00141FF7A4|nr:hypothetical protein [Thalassoroseus pseudoceratinae]